MHKLANWQDFVIVGNKRDMMEDLFCSFSDYSGIFCKGDQLAIWVFASPFALEPMHDFVLSPLLYSVYTCDFVCGDFNVTILINIDDTIVVGLPEIKSMEMWCKQWTLALNTMVKKHQ